jgi:hypothetical protein
MAASPSRTYKIRAYRNGTSKLGRDHVNYSLTVPAEVASQVPEGVVFTFEATEDGFLFRRAEAPEKVSWLNGGEPKAAGAARKRPAPKAKAKAPAPKKSAPRRRPAPASA